MELKTKLSQEIDHLATGQMVRTARLKAGIPLRIVAKKLKVSVAYASDLERGRRIWNADRLLRFTKAINAK